MLPPLLPCRARQGTRTKLESEKQNRIENSNKKVQICMFKGVNNVNRHKMVKIYTKRWKMVFFSKTNVMVKLF
jgi:hypothetical protein